MQTTISAMASALAYDRALRNPRPVFALTEELAEEVAGVGTFWRLQRRWTGAGASPIAWESVLWRDGLRESRSEQASIGESTAVTLAGRIATVALTSHRTGGVERLHHLKLPHPAVTPASLPLFIAQNWAQLAAGRSVRASYLVVKLPWATTVALRRVQGEEGVSVLVIPANPILRLMFGAARYDFQQEDAPVLRRIHGVLDPRDLGRRWGWREYQGMIAYETPLDLRGPAARFQFGGAPEGGK
jgi:hypothetical protein